MTEIGSRNDSSIRLRYSFCLLMSAFLWGTALVAQSMAMQHLGPFTYNMCRYFVGGLVLLPLALYMGKIDPLSANYHGTITSDDVGSAGSSRKNLFFGGIIIGLWLFVAGSFQQAGLLYTTTGKSGFITALYIVLVPVISWIVFRKKCSPLVWAAVVLAVAGFFFLCIRKGAAINRGDLLTLCGSVVWALQILCVDWFAQKTNGIQLSCMQLLTAGVLSTIAAVIFETPSWSSVISCIGPILYAGILSSGVGYTLQIIGQNRVNPTAASLLMSLESVIAAFSGWLILHDTLTGREIFGCVLVFAGVSLAQVKKDFS